MTETVLTHLATHARQRPQDPAFAAKVDGAWVQTSWADYQSLVRSAGRALIDLGLAGGGTVGILGANRPEWAIACLGTLSAGGVPAGIYQTCAPNQVAYILNHAESQIVIVEDAEQWHKVHETHEQLPDLQFIVLMAGAERPNGASSGPDSPATLTWEEFMARGLEVPEESLDQRLEGITRDQLATLIYTSGTTGTPKAVMLSHGNLVDTCGICGPLHGMTHEDRLLSYLPLAHVAEQMLSLHMGAYLGYSLSYVESPEQLAENIREVQPTFLFGVPRVWERIHGGIQEKLRAAQGARRRLADWAFEVGREVAVQRERGDSFGPGLALRHRLADRLVLSKIRHRMGFGKLRFCTSGAAPISRDVLEFFTALGITVYEVYGLSESSGPATWNHAGANRLGTVGPVIPGVEVRIADDGEVLFRGPNVFQGYYKNPDETAAALSDGWLHTGDIGALDEDGFLTITGRKKELLITSGGKNIAPAGIESALKELDLIAEAVLIGDRRKFLSALVTLDPEAAAHLAGGDPGVPLHQLPEIQAAVEAGVERVNQRFARVENVRAFRILPRNFTVEDGELTPTLKIKRQVILERYADWIDEIYAD